ncbi:MAG: NAD(P)H-quinone oxidoreductase [Methylomonas sp.]|nr:NAD(P)H-quinone oxidoreductase [Methylomonas sp.]PPD19929.1 MAG: NAD(P)H-quinone oxidoreductase [Methylomonas sp.]PPD25474.1 MAG: NAD(P)H-quinone oxidoreductase [Methylomonas sp.]PPD36174.1 MAG: NAD(P)H-quinone oxidoreductase [Methylomonas sp.]PPD39715.1 MAG: NAD(P)H-quinone oxidoreductase [Methylomonas sp.]
MRAIEIITPGPASQLRLVERPRPVPAPGQVLIEVAYVGVNRPDLMQRQGVYPPPVGASDIPGLEVAGHIVETCGTDAFAVGDRVCALVTGGGYAEYCVASAVCCLPVPPPLTLADAAALPETFFTVWSNVFERGRLQAGETLLVHGGSSGIGTTAIQLAKAFGAKVLVTAGSAEKCERCLALGADLAIDYRQHDFVDAVLAYTEQRGVDVILDMIGGEYFPRNLKALATEGRLVQIAIQGGNSSEIGLWRVMQKRLTITGSTLRGRDDAFKGRIAAQLQANVWPLLASGAIKPVIDTIVQLDAAEQAHARMTSSRHIGKLILEI